MLHFNFHILYFAMNSCADKYFWSNEEIEYLKQNHLHLPYYKLQKVIKRTQYAIFKKAWKMGLKRTKLRKYDVNDSFFDEWNEPSAYWLGFIAADGCLASSVKSIDINLAYKDKNHLEKFRDIISPQRPIYLTKRKEITFCIRSDRIYDKLLSLGMTPRKSLTLQFPNIPDDVIHHFIRGYSDGDGSFYIDRRNYGTYLRWSIIGTQNFLGKMFEFFKEKGLKTKSRIYQEPHTRMYKLILAGTKSQWIAEFLYYNATIFLERKYNIINHFNFPLHQCWNTARIPK